MGSGHQSEERSLPQVLVDITTVSAGLAMHGLGWNTWHTSKPDVELVGANSVWQSQDLSGTSPELAWDNDKYISILQLMK